MMEVYFNIGYNRKAAKEDSSQSQTDIYVQPSFLLICYFTKNNV